MRQNVGLHEGITISGSQASLFLELEETNIASKGLLAPEMD
jgi:hypothetical protein